MKVHLFLIIKFVNIYTVKKVVYLYILYSFVIFFATT